MTFSGLLRLLPAHERARLQQANEVQKELLQFYVQLHEDLIEYLQSQVPEAQFDNPVGLSRLGALIAFVAARVAVINTRLSQELINQAQPVADLVSSQLPAEFSALGLSPGTPDPRLLEVELLRAARTIVQWNNTLVPGMTQMLRLSVVNGDSYTDITNKALALTSPSPTATARYHMQLNVRYSMVKAANAARNSAYKDASKNANVVVRKMWWSNIKDCCIDCARLHGRVVDIDQEFNWQSLGLRITPHQRHLPHPPLHPQCRCRVIPITLDVLRTISLSNLAEDRDSRIATIIALAA